MTLTLSTQMSRLEIDVCDSTVVRGRVGHGQRYLIVPTLSYLLRYHI